MTGLDNLTILSTTGSLGIAIEEVGYFHTRRWEVEGDWLSFWPTTKFVDGFEWRVSPDKRVTVHASRIRYIEER